MRKKSRDVCGVYLGTWFPRTSLHLQELYQFLLDESVPAHLDAKIVTRHRKNLQVKKVQFHEETAINYIEVACDVAAFSMTEDGVVLIGAREMKTEKAIETIKQFYENQLSPALKYLFGRGAPLPKELVTIREVHPYLFLGNNLKKKETSAFFEIFKEQVFSSVASPDVTVSLGNTLDVVNITSTTVFPHAEDAEEFLRNIIFFKEFELQLGYYLELHRSIWDDISKIREAKDLRYRDFPKIRQQIMEFQKTLSFVDARLLQMEDIISMRNSLIDGGIRHILDELGFQKFTQLSASQKYVEHLWKMTKEYADASIELLESLYQESAQRELNALKFITFIGALTGFFGMNIAFPWDEAWGSKLGSSIGVVLVIIVVCFSIYWLLQQLIYSRRFSVKK